MTQNVTLENGEVHSFPDSATPEQIQSALAPPKTSNSIGDQIDQNKDSLASKAMAVVRGTAQGINTIGSTIQKAVTPYTYKALSTLDPLLNKIGLEARNPQTVQSDFEKETSQYKSDSDVKAHPNYAMGGEFAGNMAWQAPLIAATGGAGLARTSMSDAAPLLGRAAATVADNTALGAATAGLMNHPGEQANQVFDPEQAKTGALFGAALSPLAALGSVYSKGAQVYQNYAESLASKGYKGPVFSTDVPNQGGFSQIWSNVKQSIVNNVASKIPILSDIPGIGVNSARKAQLAGASDSVSQLVSGLADKYPNGGLQTFKNAVNNSKQLADNTISDAANKFRTTLLDNNITSHELYNSTPLMEDLLNSGANISKSLKQRLNDVVNTSSVSTNELLGTADQMGLKNQVWNEAQRLGKNKADTISFDASNDLKTLYHTLNQDIEQSVQNVPQALESFHNFNTITSNLKELWDPKKAPLIAKAAADVNSSKNAMKSAFDAMQGDSIDPAKYNQYAYMIGQQGRSAVRSQLLTDAFNSSVNNKGNFDITNFLKKVSLDPGSPRTQIMKPVQDALEGAQYIAQQANKGLEGQKSPITMGQLATATPIAAGAVATAMSNPGIVGAVTAAPLALGAITAHPPLKNALMMINQLVGKVGIENLGPDKMGLATYMMKKASDNLTKAGVIIKTMDDGSIHFDHQEDKK